MTHLDKTDEIFFTNTGLDQQATISLVSQTLAGADDGDLFLDCLLYTSPSPRDGLLSRMPSSA